MVVAISPIRVPAFSSRTVIVLDAFISGLPLCGGWIHGLAMTKDNIDKVTEEYRWLTLNDWVSQMRLPEDSTEVTEYFNGKAPVRVPGDDEESYLMKDYLLMRCCRSRWIDGIHRVITVYPWGERILLQRALEGEICLGSYPSSLGTLLHLLNSVAWSLGRSRAGTGMDYMGGLVLSRFPYEVYETLLLLAHKAKVKDETDSFNWDAIHIIRKAALYWGRQGEEDTWMYLLIVYYSELFPSHLLRSLICATVNEKILAFAVRLLGRRIDYRDYQMAESYLLCWGEYGTLRAMSKAYQENPSEEIPKWRKALFSIRVTREHIKKILSA